MELARFGFVLFGPVIENKFTLFGPKLETKTNFVCPHGWNHSSCAWQSMTKVVWFGIELFKAHRIWSDLQANMSLCESKGRMLTKDLSVYTTSSPLQANNRSTWSKST